jgi:hypothetical protein
MEAAAELIVHAALGHVVERGASHGESVVVVESAGEAQQQANFHRVREFRRVAETAVGRVEAAREFPAGVFENVGAKLPGRRRQVQGRLQMLGQMAGLFVDDLALVLPCLGDVQEQPPKRWQAVAVIGREIGAAVEGFAIGRQEHRHRPAAALCQNLHRGHVDLVEIGPFFAIDFDADEMLVENLGRFRVLEALVLHDVAPMARRVADAEENRAVQLFRLGKRLVAPGEPIDGIVRVLAQVGAGFVEQAIGELGVGHVVMIGRFVGCSSGVRGGRAPLRRLRVAANRYDSDFASRLTGGTIVRRFLRR